MTRHKVWIDLDNSPHVPFFVPIIEGLRRQGCDVVLTSRDQAQVTELVNLHGLETVQIGHHFGRNKIAKIAGTFWRAVRLALLMRRHKPDLAVSHGSRSQTIASFLMRVPCVVIFDYEFSSSVGVISPTWVMAPEVIPPSVTYGTRDRSLRYPGIKEDVYVSNFRPDPSLRRSLGLNDNDLVVIVRPPASEAHYHNPAADALMREVITYVLENPAARVVLLPRTKNQNTELRQEWRERIAEARIVVPEHAVDGLNLIWNADLVVSGGGTMNREAAALGVPVYSIFRGTTGAVDRYLTASNRLVMLEDSSQVREKIKLVRRATVPPPAMSPRPALQVILSNLFMILNTNSCRPKTNASSASAVPSGVRSTT